METLPKGYRQAQKLLTTTRNGFGVQRKQFGQHFPYHTGHEIAIAIHLIHRGHAPEVLTLLEFCHSSRHDLNAFRQCPLLPRLKAPSDLNDLRNFSDQVMFRGNRVGRQPRMKDIGKAFRGFVTPHNPHELSEETILLSLVQLGLVLYRVHDSA